MGLQQNMYLFSIPRRVCRVLQHHTDYGRNQNCCHNNRANVAPCVLPINTRSVASHLVNVLRKPIVLETKLLTVLNTNHFDIFT